MRAIRSIGWVTFQEIVSDKILYNVILCGGLLFGVTYLTSQLSFIGQDRIVLDMGLTTLNLSSVFIAIFAGVPLLAREVDRRTILISMSRPIGSFQFLMGKYLGLMGVVVLNWFILTLLYLGFLNLFGGECSGALVWGIILVLCQSFLAGALAIFLSTLTTTSLAGVMSIGLFLVGNNVSHIRLLSGQIDGSIWSHLLSFVAGILPNYEYFSLGTKVTYGLPVSFLFGISAVGYAFFYVAALLVLSPVLVRMREWR